VVGEEEEEVVVEVVCMDLKLSSAGLVAVEKVSDQQCTPNQCIALIILR